MKNLYLVHEDPRLNDVGGDYFVSNANFIRRYMKLVTGSNKMKTKQNGFTYGPKVRFYIGKPDFILIMSDKVEADINSWKTTLSKYDFTKNTSGHTDLFGDINYEIQYRDPYKPHNLTILKKRLVLPFQIDIPNGDPVSIRERHKAAYLKEVSKLKNDLIKRYVIGRDRPFTLKVLNWYDGHDSAHPELVSSFSERGYVHWSNIAGR